MKRNFPWYICNSLSRPKKRCRAHLIWQPIGGEGIVSFFGGDGGTPPPKMPGIKTAEVVTVIYTHQQLGLANMHLLNVRVSTQANRGLSTAQELNWHERVDLVTRSVHWSRAPASQWLAAASETRAVGVRSVFDTSLFQRCCSRTAVRANWSSVQFRSCAVNKSSRIQAYITVATSRKRATKPRRLAETTNCWTTVRMAAAQS